MGKQDLAGVISGSERQLQAGYTQLRLRELNALHPHQVDLRNYIGYRQHTPDQSLAIPDYDRKHIETLALAHMFINEWWNEFEAATDSFRLRLAMPDNESGAMTPLYPEISEHIKEISDKSEVIAYLYGKLRQVLVCHTDSWYAKRSRTKNSPTDDQAEQKVRRAFYRYEKLISQRNVNVGSRYGRAREEDAKSHISGGIATAYEFMWRIIQVASKVIERQYGEVTRESIETLLVGSKSLIVSMAQSGIAVFKKLEDLISLPRKFPDHVPFFDQRKFWISKSNSRMNLELSPEVLDAAERRLKSKPPILARTGCPALHGSGSNNVSAVMRMYEWFLDLLREFYFTRFESIQ